MNKIIELGISGAFGGFVGAIFSLLVIKEVSEIKALIYILFFFFIVSAIYWLVEYIYNSKNKIKRRFKNKKINLEEINTICSMILAFVAVIALVASGIASYQSNKLSKQVINLTPSKYANLDSILSDYLGNMDFDAYMNINNTNQTEVHINLVNTGQLNTGAVQISKRDEFNSDNYFSLHDVNIPDIPSKSNNATSLTFDVNNAPGIIGLHQINLSIYCANCLEQGTLKMKTIYICIYNESKYSGHSGWLRVVNNGCQP